jgi:hypothetical protein
VAGLPAAALSAAAGGRAWPGTGGQLPSGSCQPAAGCSCLTPRVPPLPPAATVGVVTEQNAEAAIGELKAYEVGCRCARSGCRPAAVSGATGAAQAAADQQRSQCLPRTSSGPVSAAFAAVLHALQRAHGAPAAWLSVRSHPTAAAPAGPALRRAAAPEAQRLPPPGPPAQRPAPRALSAAAAAARRRRARRWCAMGRWWQCPLQSWCRGTPSTWRVRHQL